MFSSHLDFTIFLRRNLAHFIVAHQIMAIRLTVMGNSEHSLLFDFVILMKSKNLMLRKYMCFTVTFEFLDNNNTNNNNNNNTKIYTAHIVTN